MALEVKNLPANAGDIGDVGATSLIPGLRRFPGVGNGNIFQEFLTEKFHGQNNKVGYSPWGHKESDTAEHAHTHILL